MPESGGNLVAVDRLPHGFPTHMHSPAFWESLGRAIATFGFLEQTLSKAIFAYTGRQEVPEDQVASALKAWDLTLQHALIDPLGRLIKTYSKSVRNHDGGTIENFDSLVEDLREASQIRNVLCHGSWSKPDAEGGSIPLFARGLNEKLETFNTRVDVAYLQKVQRDVAGLTCSVINTVTSKGWQFPGSRGPGTPLKPGPTELSETGSSLGDCAAGGWASEEGGL